MIKKMAERIFTEFGFFVVIGCIHLKMIKGIGISEDRHCFFFYFFFNLFYFYFVKCMFSIQYYVSFMECRQDVEKA